MPELRVTITEKMDRLLSEIVEETGLFTSKADLVRFATVAYLKELGWIEKPRRKS
jgi:Arc/MetJ-type ribon-helix-helix transcriptional regulator